MTQLVISGLTSESVTALIAVVQALRLKHTMVSVTQSTDAPKSSSSTAKKIQRPFLEATAQERLHRVRYLSHIFVPDDTLNGTRDISGLGILWAVSSPTISLKVLRSLPKLSKSGSPKIVSSKSERTTKGRK